MKILATLLTLATLLFAQQAIAHPADEFEPESFPMYSSLMGDSRWQVGEVKFYSPEDREAYEQLSDIELYMVAGARDAQTGSVYAPWYDQIMGVVKTCYNHYGEIPDQLSSAVVDGLDARRTLDPNSLEYRILQNPIQNRPVNLRSATFSPGDMYVQVLSKEEMLMLANLDPWFKRTLNLNIDTNPLAGGENTPVPPIDGPVYYFRVYGETGVLLAGLTYKRNL